MVKGKEALGCMGRLNTILNINDNYVLWEIKIIGFVVKYIMENESKCVEELACYLSKKSRNKIGGRANSMW